MQLSGELLPAPPARFTFRKAERLCSRRLLGALFKQGAAFNTYPLRFVVWRTEAGTAVSDDASSQPVPERPVAADEARSQPPRSTRNKEQEPLQVVLSVSKRYFKRAHDRNRIKRQLREAWRHQKAVLLGRLLEIPVQDPPLGQPAAARPRPLGTLLVAVLYIGKEKPESLSYLSRRLRKGLDRLGTELPAAPPASPA